MELGGGGVVNCHIEKVAAEVPQTVKSSSRISSQHVQGVEYHHPMQTTSYALPGTSRVNKRTGRSSIDERSIA